MFIDIHVHFRKTPGFQRNGKQAFATPEQLIERYDKLDIERAVILPGCNPECSYVPQSNEEVLETAEKNDRFIPFCNIDPRALTNSCVAPLGDILNFYRDKGCKGSSDLRPGIRCKL